MSKIVIDTRQYTTSTGRYTFRLLQYLEKIDSGHDYTILLKPEDMEAYEFSNPRFSKLACPYKEFTFDEQLALRRQIAGLKPDLVHFAIVQQPVLYHGKTVTTIHDLTTARFSNPDKNPFVFKLKQRVYRQVIKRAARKSITVITPSLYVKQDLVAFAHVRPSKVTVTYEAADVITDEAVPLPALEHKQFLMYIGRPMPHKNLGRLIEAFGLLRAQHPDMLLVLAGKKDANYQRIQDGLSQTAARNVYFTDYISEGQLRWLYEHCNAYVFPSLSEGFGLPGLEAMAYGAPVVSSNATCLPEIYGQAAHYFDPLDARAMADAINEVVTDADLRQKLIALGRGQVSLYSWNHMAEQTLEIYNQALGNSREL
jgi:glycosyltransferase involved in cell wall biosynthesis